VVDFYDLFNTQINIKMLKIDATMRDRWRPTDLSTQVKKNC